MKSNEFRTLCHDFLGDTTWPVTIFMRISCGYNGRSFKIYCWLVVSFNWYLCIYGLFLFLKKTWLIDEDTYTHTPFSIIHWWNRMFDAWIALDLCFVWLNLSFWLVPNIHFDKMHRSNHPPCWIMLAGQMWKLRNVLGDIPVDFLVQIIQHLC